MRGLLSSLPPTIVSRKWVCHVSSAVDVAERRRDAALGHDRVGLAEQRLAHEPDVRAGRLGLDRGPQAGAAGADDEDVERVGLDLVERLRSRATRRPGA